MPRKKIKCPTCDKLFEQYRSDHKFCSRLCYRRNPEIAKRYSKRTANYQNKIAREIPRRYNKLIYKSNHQKQEFRLSLSEYESLVKKGCYYCGKSLLNETGSALDRKDCTKGYTSDNVLPCCGQCNQIRNVHLTVEEMKIAMTAVLEFRRRHASN